MREVAAVILFTLLIGLVAACCHADRLANCYDAHADACLD